MIAGVASCILVWNTAKKRRCEEQCDKESEKRHIYEISIGSVDNINSININSIYINSIGSIDSISSISIKQWLKLNSMEEPHFCKACSKPITDGQAYELGADRWHMNCFRCSKCHKQLGVNSNFLVLGTGALVCADCSYTCKNCGKKIYDMAILAGDCAYCADCFKCRACKKPIEDLRYARTSKGLFCMSCHRMLMKKKKKYERMKQAKAKAKSSRKTSHSGGHSSDNSESSEKKKPGHRSGEDKAAEIKKVDHLQELVGQCSGKHPERGSNESLRSENRNGLLVVDKDRSGVHGESFIDFKEEGDVEKRQERQREEEEVLQVGEEHKTPSLTPPRPPPKSRRDGDAPIDAPITGKPAAGLNIHGISFGDASRRPYTTILASPPRTPPVPEAGLEPWKEYNARKSPFRFGVGSSQKSSPLVTSSPSHSRKNSATLGRSLTHVFHRHKRGDSGANMGLKRAPGTTKSESAAFEGQFGRLGSPIGQHSAASSPQHMRTQSEHSTSAYATPPLPSTSDGFHNRSFSESMGETAPFGAGMSAPQADLAVLRQRREQVAQAERELRLLKAEINSLTASKATIIRDIQGLKSQKRSLQAEIDDRRAEILQQVPEINTDDIPARKIINTSSSSSNSSGVDSGSTPHRKQGFMRRFFGGSQANGGEPGGGAGAGVTEGSGVLTAGNSAGISGISSSISSQSISAPIDLRQGDEALESMRGHAGANGNANGPAQPSLSSMIRSRSQNFLLSKNGKQGAAGASAGTPPAISGGSPSSILARRQRLSPILGSPTAGVGLYSLTLESRAGYELRDVPYIVSACMNEVSRRGLMCEGIYRVSGSALAIDKIEKFFSSTKMEGLGGASSSSTEQLRKMTASALDTDVHAVAGMLKRYLKKIPEPVIPFNEYESFLACSKQHSDDDKLKGMHHVLVALPAANYRVLRMLVDHLNAVVANHQLTKMSTSALATVFAPTLARDSSGNPQREILDNGAKTRSTELLLVHSAVLFGD